VKVIDVLFTFDNVDGVGLQHFRQAIEDPNHAFHAPRSVSFPLPKVLRFETHNIEEVCPAFIYIAIRSDNCFPVDIVDSKSVFGQPLANSGSDSNLSSGTGQERSQLPRVPADIARPTEPDIFMYIYEKRGVLISIDMTRS